MTQWGEGGWVDGSWVAQTLEGPFLSASQISSYIHHKSRFRLFTLLAKQSLEFRSSLVPFKRMRRNDENEETIRKTSTRVFSLFSTRKDAGPLCLSKKEKNLRLEPCKTVQQLQLRLYTIVFLSPGRPHIIKGAVDSRSPQYVLFLEKKGACTFFSPDRDDCRSRRLLSFH